MAPQNPTVPGTTAPPPETDPQFQQADFTSDVKRDWKEKLFGALSGGRGGQLDNAIQQHHQQRLDEARMHRRNASTATGRFYYIDKYNINPETGESLSDPNYQGPSADDLKRQYATEYKSAMGNYAKIAGVNPQTKEALQKAQAIIDHITGIGQYQPGQTSGQPAGQGAAPPPTPQYGTNVSDTGVSYVPPDQRQGGMPSPPTPNYRTDVSDVGVSFSAPPTPTGGGATAQVSPQAAYTDASGVYHPDLKYRSAAEIENAAAPISLPSGPVGAARSITPPGFDYEELAPFIRNQFQYEQGVGRKLEYDSRSLKQGVQDRKAIVEQVLDPSDWKKPYVQDFILTGKITGNMAASLRPPPRPVGSYTTSVLDARSRAAKTGEVFLNVAGEPIPIDDLDNSMGLKGMQTLDPNTGQWQVRYEPFSPNQSTVTADNQVFAVNPMDKSKVPGGAGEYLGAHNVPVTSTHTAPGITLSGDIGNVTTSTTRTPMAPGGARPGVGVAGRMGAGPAPPTPTGPAPTAGAGGAVPQARGGVGAAAPQARPVAPSAGGGNERAIPFGAANTLNLRIVPVREAATQLFGDPTQPDLKGLADYAHLSENTKDHPELANALQLTFKHMEQREKTEGGLMNILGNYLGKPQLLVDSEMNVMQDVIGNLSPEDQEAYNAEMAAFGTIIGLRSLTRAPATEMTAKSLERELPLFGVNTFSKTQFYDKMSRLAENVYNGSRTLPLPKAEKDFYSGKIKEYRNLAGGRKGGGPAPPTPEATGVAPKTADELLSKYGIKNPK